MSVRFISVLGRRHSFSTQSLLNEVKSNQATKDDVSEVHEPRQSTSISQDNEKASEYEIKTVKFLTKTEREQLKRRKEQPSSHSSKEEHDNISGKSYSGNKRSSHATHKFRQHPSRDASLRSPDEEESLKKSIVNGVSDYERSQLTKRQNLTDAIAANTKHTQKERNTHDSPILSQEVVEDVTGKDNGTINIQDTDMRPWNGITESSLSQLSLLKLPETDMLEKVNRKVLNQIRDHYLGLKKEKRKIQKPSEKFRNIFNFEWSAAEDTTRGDSNPLYQSRIEPQFLFGRGFRAGVDVREQRRRNNFYDEIVKKRAMLEGNQDVKAFMATSSEHRDALIRSRDLDANDPNRKHWTNKTREEMTDRDWRIFREDYEIYIKGGRVPPPIRKWSESNLPAQLLHAIQECGYDKPTPIQMQAIPISLEQRDLIGIAETGSGKTAAFVLPMLAYVKSLPSLTDETSQDGPYALILAPSRELALQIDEETIKFSSFCTCRAVAVVGGRSAEAQAFELRRGAEIVIGTPGRIKDCLERSYTVLNQCNYVVLDEADRMIDMGFEDIVKWILDQIPLSNMKSENEDQLYQQELEAKAGYRQYRLTQMFSATMPPQVEQLARKYLRFPAYISIGDPGAGKRAIEQRLEFLTEGKKRQRLQEILETAEPPIMVFVNQKKVVDVLAKTLAKMNFRVASLHGGKAQEAREQALHDFKVGQVDILVATDVAGRGIDVEGVQLVLNFDLPKDIGSYTHRIGRTGRAGRRGLAISFCTEEDSALFYDLKQLLLSTHNVVPLDLSNHPASKVKPGLTATSNILTSGGVERSDRRPPLC